MGSLRCKPRKKLNEETDLETIRKKIEEMDDRNFVYLLNEAEIYECIYENEPSLYEAMGDQYEVAKIVYYGVKYADYSFDAEYVTLDEAGRLTTAVIEYIKDEVIDELVKEVVKDESLMELL